MPSVDMAMARSLQPSAWDKLSESLARSVTAQLVTRNVIDDVKGKVTDIKTALSSWDNCMNANFCKYPVIAIIVVGSLIIGSILLCIVRCCCLGKSCCCACCKCFKCCGNCCGCCDSPEDRKHKYLDEPFVPPNQGYRTEPPMQTFAPPQYAEFDVSKKGGDDSLPQMPSWEKSESQKVNMEQESHEMTTLNASSTAAGTSMSGGMGARRQDSYGPSYSPGHSPYGGHQTGYEDQHQPYDMHPVGMAAVPDRHHSPAPTYNNYGHNNSYNDMPADSYGAAGSYRGVPSPAPVRQNTYGSRSASPGPNSYGYGMNRAPTTSPAPYGMDPHMRNSPAPRQSPRPMDNYNQPSSYGHSQDDYAGAYGSSAHQYSASPVYGNQPAANPYHQRQPSSPIVNNGGFDFTSGYSRPQSGNGYDHQQQPQAQQDGGYPGFKPYRGV